MKVPVADVKWLQIDLRSNGTAHVTTVSVIIMLSVIAKNVDIS